MLKYSDDDYNPPLTHADVEKQPNGDLRCKKCESNIHVTIRRAQYPYDDEVLLDWHHSRERCMENRIDALEKQEGISY